MKAKSISLCATLISCMMIVAACQNSTTQEVARTLAIEAWGDCTPDLCEELSVRVYKESGKQFVEAIYDGMYDDSVDAAKKVAELSQVDGVWILGNTTYETYRCKKGRGQQEFSGELCK